MSRSSLVVIVVTALFTANVLFDARRHRSPERHTLAWLLVSALIFGLAIWRPAIDELASALGIYYPPSALFFAACSALLWLVYRQSVEAGLMRAQLRRLAQEVALQSPRLPLPDDRADA
jgi:hypothetical protein